MAKDIEIQVEEGSGNVFADIGVRDPEDALLRADLAKQLAGIIKDRGLSQHQVAEIVGVDQSKVSKLMRGHIYGFTSDRLFRFLVRLGCDVKVEIRKERDARKRRGTLRVVVVAAA
jgi:predicted XRE-type DNA-binding protein